MGRDSGTLRRLQQKATKGGVEMRVRKGLAAAAVLAALLAGCGSGGGGSAKGGTAGCLSPAQVSEEETRIAEGFETSHGEVEAKREEIAAMRAREC